MAAAIRRELLREGQVFYVHNRVADIESVARRLREAVPEARIAVAHGQMNEDRLEKIIDGFWAREWDVLLCTTIVETGLDISNANTLIVDHAEVLGLSQMHQLRGRVGRGRERGYAYFLYPGDRPLTETAHDRLATIAQNSDLGAGMAVAMKDLEIRGAGSILGAEQSGHIAGVGFDLYIRLVGEAVTAFKRAAASSDGEQAEAGRRRFGSICRSTRTCRTATSRPSGSADAYRRIAGVASAADVPAALFERRHSLPRPAECTRIEPDTGDLPTLLRPQIRAPRRISRSFIATAIPAPKPEFCAIVANRWCAVSVSGLSPGYSGKIGIPRSRARPTRPRS